MSSTGRKDARKPAPLLQNNNISAIENIFYPMKTTTYIIRKRKSLKSLRKKIVDKHNNICYNGNIIIEKEEI